MPAHNDRKQVLVRMWPDELIRFDALCVAMGKDGTRLHRSDVVNKLVEQAYKDLPAERRETATNVARGGVQVPRGPSAAAVAD